MTFLTQFFPALLHARFIALTKVECKRYTSIFNCVGLYHYPSNILFR